MDSAFSHELAGNYNEARSILLNDVTEALSGHPHLTNIERELIADPDIPKECTVYSYFSVLPGELVNFHVKLGARVTYVHELDTDDTIAFGIEEIARSVHASLSPQHSYELLKKLPQLYRSAIDRVLKINGKKRLIPMFVEQYRENSRANAVPAYLTRQCRQALNQYCRELLKTEPVDE